MAFERVRRKLFKINLAGELRIHFTPENLELRLRDLLAQHLRHEMAELLEADPRVSADVNLPERVRHAAVALQDLGPNLIKRCILRADMRKVLPSKSTERRRRFVGLAMLLFGDGERDGMLAPLLRRLGHPRPGSDAVQSGSLRVRLGLEARVPVQRVGRLVVGELPGELCIMQDTAVVLIGHLPKASDLVFRQVDPALLQAGDELAAVDLPIAILVEGTERSDNRSMLFHDHLSQILVGCDGFSVNARELSSGFSRRLLDRRPPPELLLDGILDSRKQPVRVRPLALLQLREDLHALVALLHEDFERTHTRVAEGLVHTPPPRVRVHHLSVVELRVVLVLAAVDAEGARAGVNLHVDGMRELLQRGANLLLILVVLLLIEPTMPRA